jgi:hypothetical protein
MPPVGDSPSASKWSRPPGRASTSAKTSCLRSVSGVEHPDRSGTARPSTAAPVPHFHSAPAQRGELGDAAASPPLPPANADHPRAAQADPRAPRTATDADRCGAHHPRDGASSQALSHTNDGGNGARSSEVKQHNSFSIRRGGFRWYTGCSGPYEAAEAGARRSSIRGASMCGRAGNSVRAGSCKGKSVCAGGPARCLGGRVS